MGVVKSPRVGSLTLLSVLLAGTIFPLNAITQLDFYQSYGKGDILRQGDSEFEMVKLEPPMPFFSSTFDHIYVSSGPAIEYSLIVHVARNIPVSRGIILTALKIIRTH